MPGWLTTLGVIVPAIVGAVLGFLGSEYRRRRDVDREDAIANVNREVEAIGNLQEAVELLALATEKAYNERKSTIRAQSGEIVRVEWHPREPLDSTTERELALGNSRVLRF